MITRERLLRRGGAEEGRSGGSIHVHARTQAEVEQALVDHLLERGFESVVSCLADLLRRPPLPAYGRRRAPRLPVHLAPDEEEARAFLVAPERAGWVSVYERGERGDPGLACRLSEALSTAAVYLWPGGEDGSVEVRSFDQGGPGADLASASVPPPTLEDYAARRGIEPVCCTRYDDLLAEQGEDERRFDLGDVRYLSFRLRHEGRGPRPGRGM